jgi:hypothetical protein
MPRGIRKVPSPGIVLSWRGVEDVIPHVPAAGTAWDLPETRRAWWRGIRLVGALFAANAVVGVLGFVTNAKTWYGGWTEAVVVLSAFGAIYVVVRGRLWWLLRSQPWQMWHGTPARPPARPRTSVVDWTWSPSPAVIRVNGVHPDGSTVTALLRASRIEASPDESLGAFGPLLVLRRGSGLALVAVPGGQARIRVARLPRTVREHDSWEETFNEWMPNPGDE